MIHRHERLDGVVARGEKRPVIHQQVPLVGRDDEDFLIAVVFFLVIKIRQIAHGCRELRQRKRRREKRAVLGDIGSREFCLSNEILPIR